ncbi:MAG: OmpA family protein [Burkholderiales bacterium]|nr:OmpA family protein [Burkholderiales bacterium]
MNAILKSLSALGVAASCLAVLPAAAQAPAPKGPLGGPEAYVIDTAGAIVKNPFGLCWRTSQWSPANAACECDKDILPRERCAPPAPKPAAAPAPAPAPAAKPAPAPMAKPKVCDFTAALTGDATFDFDRAVLKPAARAQLDRDVIARLGSCASITVINVNGHTDRIGSATYNQKLSERRAAVVRDYLVSKGVDRSKVETYGYGKTTPIKSCPDTKDFKALIACLAPNRRAEVQVKGPAR